MGAPSSARVMAASVVGVESSTLERYIYGSCAIDPSKRELIMELYSAWKQLSWKPADFDMLLETAGYHIPRRTLNRGVGAIGKTDDTTAGTEKRGRKQLFQPSQAEIVVGHAMSLVCSGKVVNPADLSVFAFEQFEIKPSQQTMVRLLCEYGFTGRTAQRMASMEACDTGEMADLYAKWLNKQRELGMIPTDLSLLGSIDFTHTKHTTSKLKTYAPKGRWVSLTEFAVRNDFSPILTLPLQTTAESH